MIFYVKITARDPRSGDMRSYLWRASSEEVCLSLRVFCVFIFFLGTNELG